MSIGWAKSANRALGLTEAGLTFLHEARETLRQADHAITTARETAAGRTGRIRLGYVGSALFGRLPDTIRRFRRARPNGRLELRDATTAAQIAGLRDGTLDAGIVILPIAEPAGIELHHFDQDRLCIAMSLGHPLASKDDLCIADIADEDFVLWSRGVAPTSKSSDVVLMPGSCRRSRRKRMECMRSYPLSRSASVCR